MRSLLVIALVACGDSKAAVDAPPDPVACKVALEATLDRTCSVPSDCMLVASADCCGTIELGVHVASNFPQSEATYEACLACGPRGCDHADLAEDGNAANTGQTIVATCIASRCTSVVQ